MARRARWRPWLKAALITGYFAALVGLTFMPAGVLMLLGRTGAIDDAAPWMTPVRVGGILLAVLAVMTLGRVDVTAQGRALSRLRTWGSLAGLSPSTRIGLAYAADARAGLSYGDAPSLIKPDVRVWPFEIEGTAKALLALAKPAPTGTLALIAYRVERPLANDVDDVAAVDATVLLIYGLGELPIARSEPQAPASAVASGLGGGDVRVESAAFNAQWRVTRGVRTASLLPR